MEKGEPFNAKMSHKDSFCEKFKSSQNSQPKFNDKISQKKQKLKKSTKKNVKYYF